MENPNPEVMKDLKFYLAAEGGDTALGEFRRVWLTTPDCESRLPEAVINENYIKTEVVGYNTFIYHKNYGGKNKVTADQLCRDKGLVTLTNIKYTAINENGPNDK